ncbi:MAG: hypothetical protein HN981_03400 [Candidatus Pacebacteria bacterium]|jgi:hypothetical protein|nr:hypothetical protein [Candidatus Paceibacterota bacterium]MBT4651958.1 hypothetical protein [Candidatus Paceibacterota bacterium]MBT6755980.1 hypothetical protein [Candidatus Paceibacterota bacterium]MBT6921408.1 hypothetical protein [Candidatus Paceibacterota bacterium]
MLDKEYHFFQNNLKKFVKEFPNKFLVIKGEKVIGVYENEVTAYEETLKNNDIGTFLIQKSIPEEESVQTFQSRVIFR